MYTVHGVSMHIYLFLVTADERVDGGQVGVGGPSTPGKLSASSSGGVVGVGGIPEV